MKWIVCIILVLIPVLLFLAGCQPEGDPVPEPDLSTAAPAEVTPAREPTPAQKATPVPPVETVEERQPDRLDIPYTEENPLTDEEEIQAILDILQERELIWFSRPGWFQFTRHYPQGHDYTKIMHIWTHAINEKRECREQFVYYEYKGETLPFTIRLEDGPSGFIIPVSEGRFQRADMVRETSPACTLKSNWIMTFHKEGDDYDFIIHDEASEFRSYLNRDIPGNEDQYRAWVMEIDGKKILVLIYDITIGDPALRGTILDPTTGYQTFYTRNVRYTYIDLETGLQVRFMEEFYQENGQRLNTDGDIGTLYRYEYHEALPKPVAQAYDQTEQALRAFLQEMKK